MNQDRTVETYRKHKLLAAFHQGGYKGRVWDCDGKLLTEIEGAGVNTLLSKLRDFVDKTFVDRANSRTSSPDAMEYIRAFQGVLEGLPDSYLAMLKGHYNAPNRTVTATQLSELGKYKNWSSANLHYGLLGKRLYEELPIKLPTRPDGTEIYTFTLATEGGLSQDESQWQWKMRPEVAEAIEQLGLQK